MRLAEWLSINGKTDAWLAREIGIDRSFLTKVKNGKAQPSVEVAAAIQRLSDGAVTAVDYVGVDAPVPKPRKRAA